MKRFKFRFDTMLRHRCYLERLALMELAKVKLELVKVEKNIGSMETAKQYKAEQLEELEDQGLSVRKYRFYALYIQGLDHRIVTERLRVKDLEKEIEEKNSVVEEQRMKKEILETMRRNAHKKHVDASILLEQKSADELANLRRCLVKK